MPHIKEEAQDKPSPNGWKLNFSTFLLIEMCSFEYLKLPSTENWHCMSFQIHNLVDLFFGPIVPHLNLNDGFSQSIKSQES